MSFYPAGASIPDELRTNEFILRPLLASDVELDYAAVMGSKEMLRRWSQSHWPADDFTLAGNLKDLQRHEQEHIEGQAFTFTIMNPAEDECLGCVYLEPLASNLQDSHPCGESNRHVTNIGYWVRTSYATTGLDKRVLKALLKWFEEAWAFDCLLFLTNQQYPPQMKLFTEVGLKKWHEFETKKEHTGVWIAYK